MKLVFDGTDECYFAQQPRNCLKTHEDAIVVCGRKQTVCYVPSEEVWYLLARKPYTLHMSQAFSSCNSKIYFVGESVDCHSVMQYDPQTNTWSSLKSFNQVVKYTSVVTFQGALYVIGGMDKHDEVLSKVLEYNPDTNLWNEVAPLGVARSSVCAVADRNSLYAIGGISSSGRLKIVERFNPEQKEWSRVASTLSKRGSAGGAAVNQKVFVFGGVDRDVPVSQFCEMYDPSVDTWICVTQTAHLGRGSTSAVSFKGKIYVCGRPGGDDPKKMSLHIYDAVRREWEFCINVPLTFKEYVITRLRIPREVLDTCFDMPAEFS